MNDQTPTPTKTQVVDEDVNVVQVPEKFVQKAPKEHYIEAEELLIRCANSDNAWEQEILVARAGVHAQLAAINPRNLDIKE